MAAVGELFAPQDIPASNEAGSGRGELATLARGGTLSLVGAIVTALLTVVLTIIVTRGFGQNEAGTFFSATSLFLILEASAKLGADTALLYFLPRFRTQGRQREANALLRAAFPPVLVAGLILGIVVFAFAEPIARVVLPNHSGNLQPMLHVLAVFLPIAALYDVATAGTRGFTTMMPTVIVEKIARPLVQPILIVLVLLFSSDPKLLAAAWSLPYLPAGIAMGLLLVRWVARMHRNHEGPAVEVDFAKVRREFWGYTGPRALSSIFMQALARMDIILVAALRSPKEAAVYAAATRFLSLGKFGMFAVQQAVQPQLSALMARGDKETTDRVYRTSTSWIIAVSWPLYLAFAVLADVLLRIFGKNYGTGNTVIIYLSIAMLFATACGSVDVMLNMAGRSTWSLFNNGVALVIDLVLDLILIPSHGIVGAALAWAIAIIIGNVLATWQVRASMGMSSFGKASVAIGGISLVCYGAIPLAARLLFGASVGVSLASVTVGTLLYLEGLRRTRGLLHLHALTSMVRRRHGRRSKADANSVDQLSYTPTATWITDWNAEFKTGLNTGVNGGLNTGLNTDVSGSRT